MPLIAIQMFENAGLFLQTSSELWRQPKIVFKSQQEAQTDRLSWCLYFDRPSFSEKWFSGFYISILAISMIICWRKSSFVHETLIAFHWYICTLWNRSFCWACMLYVNYRVQYLANFLSASFLILLFTVKFLCKVFQQFLALFVLFQIVLRSGYATQIRKSTLKSSIPLIFLAFLSSSWYLALALQ